MHNQDLGRVAVVARGIYDPLAEYERLDAVSYNGSSYLVRKHCQGVEPAEGEYYMLMAKAGDSTAANAAAVEALAAAERANTAAGNADQNAAAAGAAADSANTAAAAAWEVVDTVMPDVQQLKNDLDNYKNTINDIVEFEIIESKNLLNVAADGWETGYLRGNDVVIETGYEALITTYYIPVKENSVLNLSRISTGTNRIAETFTVIGYYDANKVMQTRQTEQSLINVPSGISYVRLTINKDWNYTSARVYKPMLEYGETISEYSSYHEPYEACVLKDSTGEIVCWGDSLTYGSGSTAGNSYPEKLASLTGKTVYRCGYPSETSLEIAGMQGAIPMLVAPVTIPSNGSVTISIYDCMLSSDTPFRFPSIVSLTGINPVTIAGIRGNIDLSASQNVDSREFTFTRLEAGEEITTTWYEPLITSCSKNRESDIAIIFIGQNGGWDSKPETLANQIRNMVDFQKVINKKYIVIGLTTGTSESRSALERTMINSFGGHYINARSYLSQRAIYDEGLTPTETDLSQMQVGTVPESLRNDGTHLNDYGYDALAKIIYRTGVRLGYWK